MRLICLKRWQNNALSHGQERAYDCKSPAMGQFHFCLSIYMLASPTDWQTFPKIRLGNYEPYN